MQTVEAIIDENGKVRLLENIKLPEARKVVLKNLLIKHLEKLEEGIK